MDPVPGGYRRDASAGQMTTSMTGFYPWVGYQVNDRVSVWGVTGYGSGGLSLTPAGQAAMETGVSMVHHLGGLEDLDGRGQPVDGLLVDALLGGSVPLVVGHGHADQLLHAHRQRQADV